LVKEKKKKRRSSEGVKKAIPKITATDNDYKATREYGGIGMPDSILTRTTLRILGSGGKFVSLYRRDNGRNFKKDAFDKSEWGQPRKRLNMWGFQLEMMAARHLRFIGGDSTSRRRLGVGMTL